MPQWQGYVFIVIGVIVAILTPTLVRLNQHGVNAINRRIVPIQLKMMGIEHKMPDNIDDSALGKWQRFSYWFYFLLMAVVFVAFGIGVVLSGQPTHHSPSPR